MLEKSIENIIFLPGWSFKASIWERQSAYFSSLKYNVTICELESLTERLKNIKLEKTILVAWSLGWFKLINELEKCCFLPRAIIGVASSLRFRPSLIHLIIRRFEKDVHSLFYDFDSWLFTSRERQNLTYKDKQFLSKNRISSKHKLLEGLLFLKHIDLSKILPKLDIPILLISGREDIITPLDEAVKINYILPNSQLEIMNTGHMPFLTQEEEFNQLVTAYIKEI
jgi:pimeloyl-ACP methyl ester carboxylesterase